MYALSFDMSVANLQQHYGEPYNGAYYEIKRILADYEFYWIQGSTYLTEADNLRNLFMAIEALKQIDWFKKSIRDIRGYRVEEWSDFTDIVKK